MPRPQLKFGDMEPIVLFDSVGARAVPNGPMDVTSLLSFTNAASFGIEAPSFSEFAMLNTGNPNGTQALQVGRQLATSGFFQGPAAVSSSMVPLATSSTALNKLYCATPWGTGTSIEVLNQSTGAVLIPAFNAGVGTIRAVYGSKSGALVVIAGSGGLTILDTTTDILTPVPGTLGFTWQSPFISENDAFIMAVKVVAVNEVHYFTGAGALIASYVNPAGVATIGPAYTHQLVTDSVGTNAWLIYNTAGSQKVVQFTPGTGAVINTYTLGLTTGGFFLELLYSESLDRLVARWDQGYQLDLLTASIMASIAAKTNMPRFVTGAPAQSGMMLSPDGNSVLLIADTFYDSAVRVIDITGVPVPFGAGALTTLNVLALPITALNQVMAGNILRGVTYSSDMTRVFVGTSVIPSSIYSVGIYSNNVVLNTISPLNSGTIFLDGSVAMPPLRTLYTDMISPAGGSSENSAPTTAPMGAVRINRIAPKEVVGDVQYGDGGLLVETSTFYSNILSLGDVSFLGATLDVINGVATFNNPFTEFSGAQLEINSPTDVNGAMTFQGSNAVFLGGTALQFNTGSILTSDATGQITWLGNADFQGANPVTSTVGFTGSTSHALFPLGIGIDGYFVGNSITTVAPATDLVINAVSGDITSSSNLKTIEDFECTTPSSLAGGAPADRGLVLKDNAGVRWRVTVSTLGALRVFLA